MATVISKIDTSSKEFAANVAAMEAQISELRQRTAKAMMGGGAKSTELHKSRGKMLPRERITASALHRHPWIASVPRVDSRDPMVASDVTAMLAHLMPAERGDGLRAPAGGVFKGGGGGAAAPRRR